MGTRSDIIVKGSDGKWRRIYCHWDGYPENNGRILVEHYNSQERADLVVSGGDMSSLDKFYSPEETSAEQGVPPHSYDEKWPDVTVLYGRDRGEKDVEAKVGNSLSSVWPPRDTWTEWTYVWEGDGIWKVCPAGHTLASARRSRTNGLRPVADVLQERAEAKARAKAAAA